MYDKHGIRILTPPRPPKRKEFCCEISKSTRIKAMQKTGGRCFYCGEYLQVKNPKSSNYLTLDHIIPICKGGDDAIDNLVPACGKCNQEKGKKTLEEFYMTNHHPPAVQECGQWERP